MIRAFRADDLDPAMELWLRANLEAHPFISRIYWEQNFHMVRELLPQAELWVQEQDEKLLGFVGLTDDYIAGIFVDGNSRSRGIGKGLLDHVKQLHHALTLHVYEKNQRAVNFYLREGFLIQSVQTDETTGEPEFLMTWNQ